SYECSQTVKRKERKKQEEKPLTLKESI
ncbi:uncharacterized protein METZ01_LOCUS202117, partial [marine metagenome]